MLGRQFVSSVLNGLKEIHYDYLSVVIIFNLNSELSRIILNETEDVEVSSETVASGLFFMGFC